MLSTKLYLFLHDNQEMKHVHGKLLAKLLHTKDLVEVRCRREHSPSTVPVFDRLHLGLEDVLEAFIDNSVPLRRSDILEIIEPAFQKVKRSAISPITLIRARNTIEHTIKQLSNRASGRACFETKLNAFKALIQIGVQTISFKLENKKGGRAAFNMRLFEGSSTELLLTDTLVVILKSFTQQERERMAAYQTFCNAIVKLNDTRKSIPGSLAGLSEVVAFIRNPPWLLSARFRQM